MLQKYENIIYFGNKYLIHNSMHVRVRKYINEMHTVLTYKLN